jgi:hypothetical protein
LALPTLLAAPRDHDRSVRGQPSRRLYQIDRDVIGARHLVRKPLAVDLNYDEQYRVELAIAAAEVYLVTDHALAESYLQHRPLREFRDPQRVLRARQTCNGSDPIQYHLNPLLRRLNLPLL